MVKDYPLLLDRVKASFIDAIVLIAMMYAASEIFALFDSVPNYVRIITSIFIFLLYDPLLTSFYGGTIGHSFSNIGVRKDDNLDEYISLPIAVVRFVLKALLGWISLLTVTGNEKKKAIHDFAANSVVIKIVKD
jgi:uncharacterized RDD family membrane protein YckC